MEHNNTLAKPLNLLRLEGIVWFLVSLYFYTYFQGTWSLFFSLILIPDLSLIGYLFGSKVGAICYNIMHVEIWPAILAIFSIFFGFPLLIQIAFIWFCHINFDRMLGLGLKYTDGFTHTHLGVISFKIKSE